MSIRIPTVSAARAAALLAALALLAFAGLLAARRPPNARASGSQVTVMMDDDHLLYRSDRARVRALETMKKLGVQFVRVTMKWSVVAGQAHSTPARRRRFRPDDPTTYPKGSWDRFDLVDREATGIGLGVYFVITGPGPPWTHQAPPAKDRKYAATWKPNAQQFYSFVLAAGKRYSGTATDRQHATIPRVSWWGVWNEPNLSGRPQSARRQRPRHRLHHGRRDRPARIVAPGLSLAHVPGQVHPRAHVRGRPGKPLHRGSGRGP
jgi:hypothetical protein